MRSAVPKIRLRWIVSLLGGVSGGLATVPWLGLAAALLAGWAILALIATTWTLSVVWPMNARQTKEHATTEDPGRGITRLIATVGSVASLAAVLFVAVQARRSSGLEADFLAGIAVLSVVTSWLLIQADYMLYYARVFYRDGGGINFNQLEDPEYSDFAYFAVGLGMTYQVADTNVTSNSVRRIVIAQTMLAYLFGAGIIATVINLITSIG